MKTLRTSAIIGILTWGWGSLVVGQTLTWSPEEGETDLNWSNPFNWAAEEVPGLDPFIFALGADGSDEEGEVTSILDQSRTLTGITALTPTDPTFHRFDLGGHNLTMDGGSMTFSAPAGSELFFQNGSIDGSLVNLAINRGLVDFSALSSVNLSVTNFRTAPGSNVAEARFGDNVTLTVSGEIDIATSLGAVGHVTMGDFTQLYWGDEVTPLSILRIGRAGSNQNKDGSLTVGANSSYEIFAGIVSLGEHTANNAFRADGVLDLSGSVSGRFDATGNIIIGNSARGALGVLNFGENATVTLGRQDTPVTLSLGESSGNSSGTVHGEMVAGSGSEVSMYFSTARVGVWTGSSGNRPTTTALLDLREATGQFTAGHLIVGSGQTAIGQIHFGDMDVQVGVIEMGVPLDTPNIRGARGEMDLHGSRLSFDVMILDASSGTSRVTTHVLGKSAGVEMANSSSLIFTDGFHEIIFHDPVPFAGWYTGFSWEGDRVSTLESWISSSWLVIDDTTFLSAEYAGLAEIVYLEDLDTTVIGFQVIPEPGTVALLLGGMLAGFLLLRRSSKRGHPAASALCR